VERAARIFAASPPRLTERAPGVADDRDTNGVGDVINKAARGERARGRGADRIGDGVTAPGRAATSPPGAVLKSAERGRPKGPKRDR
jgi:hypothetical protein